MRPLNMGDLMEPDLILFMICLVFFTGWLSFLTNRLNHGLVSIEDSDQGVAEIAEGLGEVVTLLQQLPEWLKEEIKQYVPEFHINQGQTWLQPIVEHLLGNAIGKEHSSSAPPSVRDTGGRFIGSETEENNPPTP